MRNYFQVELASLSNETWNGLAGFFCAWWKAVKSAPAFATHNTCWSQLVYSNILLILFELFEKFHSLFTLTLSFHYTNVTKKQSEYVTWDIYRWQNKNFLVSLLELKFFCHLLVIKGKLWAENINSNLVAMRCISVNRPITRPLRKYTISNAVWGGAVSFWKNTPPHSFKGIFSKSCGSSFCRNRRDISPEDVFRRLRDQLTDQLQLHTTY